MVSVFLASSSPRRQELLAQMEIPFEVVTVEIDESRYEHEKPRALVERLAITKAQAAIVQNDISPAGWVLAGDTLVVVQTNTGLQVLGKPKNRQDAQAMIQMLSGSVHKVFSSIAVAHQGMVEVRVNETEVTFSQVDANTLEVYLDSSEPYDKAGAYAIQGQAAKWISNINGSYYAVVGLPVYELEQILKSLKFYESFVQGRDRN